MNNNMKICKICLIEKDSKIDFQPVNLVCLKCKNFKQNLKNKEYFKEYYKKNKEIMKEKYINNSEHYKKKALVNYHKNMNEEGRVIRSRGRPKKEIVVEKIELL